MVRAGTKIILGALMCSASLGLVALTMASPLFGYAIFWTGGLVGGLILIVAGLLQLVGIAMHPLVSLMPRLDHGATPRDSFDRDQQLITDAKADYVSRSRFA